MSDENGTIKQRFELEDKVTPALDSMLKSIQGTTTAMGALLESVERFKNAASQGGFNINFEQTADAVRNISDAYENAAKHAQGLVDAASNIQATVPVANGGTNAAAIPSNPASPEASPTRIEQLNAEYDELKDKLSTTLNGITEDARKRFASMTAPAKQAFQDIALSAKIRFAPVLKVADNIKKKFGPAFNTIKTIGTTTAQIIGNRFKAAFEMAKNGCSKFKSMMQSMKSSVPKGGSNGGSGEMLGGLLSNGLMKKLMFGGSVTAAFAGFKKLADTASARTTQINSLNYMSESQRNGLKGDEIQDYGVKYANRIGMSADDFTAQSIKMLKTTDAFGSIGEAMNFNELLQKQLKASGVDAQGASRVTEMYSRGLMKGFDSRELKTIMEEAPALADALAKAAKVNTPAELLSKAGKGKITSQVAKDAIFGNADDIEKQFEQTPKTMNELFEKLKNSAAQALDPISQKITDIANKPEVQAFVDRLIEGMTWFSGVAGEAFEFVTDAIGSIAPYVEEIVTPIKDILFSVWDIIKGLIDDITEMFTKDEEFGKSAQAIWGDFRIVLERLKPIVEGFVETIAGGIKILMGVAKNVVTLYENARTGLHNMFSDDPLEYKSFDTDVFVNGATQIAGGIEKGVSESLGLVGDILTKNLKPIVNTPFVGPTLDMVKTDDDRIRAGQTPTKPLHVKQVGKTKIDKESLQLLKDLAQAEIINRVNNIQPAITANFGDVHETADVDAMLDRLEKDVVSARGQNLMMQTGMQYAL